MNETSLCKLCGIAVHVTAVSYEYVSFLKCYIKQSDNTYSCSLMCVWCVCVILTALKYKMCVIIEHSM